ncbi:MAG: hypothetical protein QW356_07100, partial [Candidatus Hadarchaeales archaeon]
MENSIAKEIKQYLLKQGGEEEEIRNPYEEWRIRFSDSTFVYYKKSTLYGTPSPSNDPSVLEAWHHIDLLVGSSFVLPTKDFLIGFDETGKGELIGHMILTGVIFPKEIFRDLDLLVGPADTKKRHRFEYWDDIFIKLDRFRKAGLDFVYETVPPWEVDRYNINKIMDITYQRILNIFFRKAEMGNCRIVLDDYGIGSTLKRFLQFLKNNGSEVVIIHNADLTYLEAKIASLISKRIREEQIKKINEDSKFQIEGLSVGSGNANDSRTISWLKKWFEKHKSWPWFVKRSFSTVQEIEGRPEKLKETPPIRENLLSEEFLCQFNKGRLSIQSLSVTCPSCGFSVKAATFAIFEKNGHKVSDLKCPNCGELIRDSRFTLRYYCGYVIPDSSAIRRHILSKDLEASRFFEDFTVVLLPIVRKECDCTPSGKEEFEKLSHYNAIGRIRLECPGTVEDVQNLDSTIRDEKIVEACIE